MAKIKLNFPLTNSLGDHSMYQMHGVKKTILRAKGGPNLRQVRTMPQLEKMRNNGSEFSGASKMASGIRRTLYAVDHLADFNYISALTSIAKKIQKQDTISLHGQRCLPFSKYATMIQGFNLNKDNLFDKVIMASPTYTIFRDQYRAIVSIPELFQGTNLTNPKGLPYYKIMTSLAVAMDMIWTSNGYVKKNDQILFNPVLKSTDWLLTTQNLPATTFDLMLPADTIIDETCTLVLAIGIDFGYPSGDGEMKSIKYAGSAKVLAVG